MNVGRIVLMPWTSAGPGCTYCPRLQRACCLLTEALAYSTMQISQLCMTLSTFKVDSVCELQGACCPTPGNGRGAGQVNSNLSCTLSFPDSFSLESWLGSRHLPAGPLDACVQGAYHHHATHSNLFSLSFAPSALHPVDPCSIYPETNRTANRGHCSPPVSCCSTGL